MLNNIIFSTGPSHRPVLNNWLHHFNKSTKLDEFDFFSIVRPENGDLFPHPSFACTTVGFWVENGLSWRVGDDPKDPGVWLLNHLTYLDIKWGRMRALYYL